MLWVNTPIHVHQRAWTVWQQDGLALPVAPGWRCCVVPAVGPNSRCVLTLSRESKHAVAREHVNVQKHAFLLLCVEYISAPTGQARVGWQEFHVRFNQVLGCVESFSMLDIL